eukprot:GFUD01094060.1.p1 GENE.GFUD01094060.1~~GFUD01094060.1.p1  ORF type:complete len:213 (+),score=73.04 GFUD01094060.1:93-641(+)
MAKGAVGEQKEELQELMLIKKTMMKLSQHCYDSSRWKEASSACALDQVGGNVGKMVKDVKEKDTLGLLGKGRRFDRKIHLTCMAGAIGLLKGGQLSKKALLKEAALFSKGPEMLEATEAIISDCFNQIQNCTSEEDILQDQVIIFMQCLTPNLIHSCFKNRIRFLTKNGSDNDFDQYVGEEE